MTDFKNIFTKHGLMHVSRMLLTTIFEEEGVGFVTEKPEEIFSTMKFAPGSYVMVRTSYDFTGAIHLYVAHTKTKEAYTTKLQARLVVDDEDWFLRATMVHLV